MKTILLVIGTTLLGAGLAYQVAAGRNATPGRSWFALLLRGGLQRREDYTEIGWRYLHRGLALGLGGIAVLALATFVA